MIRTTRACKAAIVAALAAFMLARAADAKEQTFMAVIKNVTADDTLKLPGGQASKARLLPAFMPSSETAPYCSTRTSRPAKPGLKLWPKTEMARY